MKRQVIEVLSGKGNTSALTTNDLFILVNEVATDIFVTGGTYSSGTTEFTFTNNTGGTFNVTGFYIPSATTAYKVFTALLTQSGGDNPSQTNYQNQESLTIGQTYHINSNVPVSEGGTDFTNVGASNNNIDTYFIATGTTPIWGTQDGSADYNTGAPVATVLENTIGNIWFTYNSTGYYLANSNELFPQDKSWTPTIQIFNDTAGLRDGEICEIRYSTSNEFYITTFDQSGTNVDSKLSNTPIEIRVYN